MNDHDRMTEARLAAALAELAGPSTPGFRNDILAATSRTRQRAAWSYPERWLPMAVITRPAATPALRPLWLLLIALLIAALAVGGAIVGGALLRSQVAIPYGGDAVFAFSSTPGPNRSGTSVMTIRADGSDVRRLTAPDSTEWRDAQFSPDGTHIAVRGWKGGIQTIVVMDAGGNDLTPIATLNTPMVDCVGEWRVAWSPDSSALAYALATGCPGDSRIYVASADGARPPAPLLEEDWNASDPVWSPDGRRIAFVAGDGATSGAFIVEVDEDGTLREGSSPRQVGPPGGVSAVRWSPDGSRLAISREEGAGETTVPAILIVDVDGTSPTTRIERAYNPSWSPDGSRMSYASTVDPSEYWNGRPCTVRLGIREPNGELRTLEPLSDGCESWATWSPDGTRLAALVIASTPEEPEAGFHLAFVPVDSEAAPVLAQDALGGSWQPLAVPLPPAPSFGAAP